ncbi:MAG: prenyltransferase/squalene oxidase repeat-containing protein [Planctomycetota bacterium]
MDGLEREPGDRGRAEEREAGLPAWFTETPYWAVSTLVHLLILFALSTVAILKIEEEETDRRTVIRREFTPPLPEKRHPRDLEERPQINLEEQMEPVVPTRVEVAIKPKGTDERHHSDRRTANDAFVDPIGLAGGGTQARGDLRGKGSPREGGSRATEDAVLAALRWLKRHQHADGRWSSSGFLELCRDSDRPCVHSDPEHAPGDGRGFEGHDVGVTALAMLAFLGSGHTHRDGVHSEFREVMRRAMRWMKQQQLLGEDPQRDGLYGAPGGEGLDEWVYNHAIATMAMAELLFLSRDVMNLRASVEAATEWCLRAQNEGYGWKYGYRTGRNDSSVTGWMVLALKTAKSCSEGRLLGIDRKRYGRHLGWALAWFDAATSGASGRTGYENPGDEGSRLQGFYPEPYPYSKDLSCMTAVALLCRLFAGERRSSKAVKRAAEILMEELPAWRPARRRHRSRINLYYWYYGSHAMFQFGGKRWRTWNVAMQEALLPTQRSGGCEDGSWDPIGEWGAAGGRVYSTAIGAMTLEVYYRFRRQQGIPAASRQKLKNEMWRTKL